MIYLTNARPDIVHSVNVISRFINKPSQIHFAATKRILRYLQGTKKLGLKYVKDADNKITSFTDNDWAGSLDERKSTSGYLFSSDSKVISWSSRKQRTVALSSAEVEYIAAIDAACEAVWLQRILADLQQKNEEPTFIYCDNMSATAMTKNPIFHARSKHIELQKKEEICLEFVNTNDLLADILTKVVASEKFGQFKMQLKITN